MAQKTSRGKFVKMQSVVLECMVGDGRTKTEAFVAIYRG